MLINAYIYQETANKMQRAYFTGECEAIPMRTNVPELAGELVQFYGDTEDDVIKQIICVLKSRNMTGKLRIKK
jgi:hypothetical protein